MREGYTVHAVGGPSEALRFLEANTEVIDLVATDLVMPGMNGRELAQRVRAMQPKVRVLFLSGYSDSVAIHHGMLTHGTAFLQKPFSRGALSRTVRSVLDAPPDEI